MTGTPLHRLPAPAARRDRGGGCRPDDAARRVGQRFGKRSEDAGRRADKRPEGV